MKAPRGTLIALNEAETIFSGLTERKRDNDLIASAVARNIAPSVKEKEAVIEVITTEGPQEECAFKSYKKAFKKSGFSNVQHMSLSSREAANDDKNLARLQKCDVVIFACHHFLKLSSILGGTIALRVLKDRYVSDVIVIAGVNAGASALSDVIINVGDSSKSYLKGELNVSIGFGFVQNLLIDANSDTKGRLGRVVQAIAEQPGKIYIGLTEGTGILIEKGAQLRVIGSSSVIVIDGSRINNNNIAAIKDGMPVSAGNLIVHLMAQQDVYDVHSREYESRYFEEYV